MSVPERVNWMRELLRVLHELLRHDERARGARTCRGSFRSASPSRDASRPGRRDRRRRSRACIRRCGPARARAGTWLARAADHHRELALPVDLVPARWDADGLAVGDQGRSELREEVGVVARVVRPPCPRGRASSAARWRVTGWPSGRRSRPARHLRLVFGVVDGRVQHGLRIGDGRPDPEGLPLVVRARAPAAVPSRARAWRRSLRPSVS